MPKQHVLDLFGRLPQALAQYFEQNEADVRALLEDRHEVPAMQYQELAVGHRHRISRPLGAVEQRDLAKAVAGLHDVEDDFLSFGRNRAHFEPAAQHRHHAVSRRALGEDLVTQAIALDPRVMEQGVDLVAAQLPEQEVTLEYLPFFPMGWSV